MDFKQFDDDLTILSAALGCSETDLYDVVVRTVSFCEEIKVPRRTRSKRPRVVWRTEDPLRRIQRQVALWLRPHAERQHACVTAFRPGASPVKNAAVHAGAGAVITADLADFYGSITLIDVTALFERLGAGRQIAVALARLSTIDERLMQGGRASPFIANLVGERLDEVVLARLSGTCHYTRYVDDLAISGDPSSLPSAQQLEEWVGQAGFKSRPGSVRVKRKEAGPYVTGLYVGGRNPTASRRIRRRMERFLRLAEKHDVGGAMARTLRLPHLAENPAEALEYALGVAHWMQPIDEALSLRWQERIFALMTRDALP